MSECSWGFDERSGANPAIMPSLRWLYGRQPLRESLIAEMPRVDRAEGECRVLLTEEI